MTTMAVDPKKSKGSDRAKVSRKGDETSTLHRSRIFTKI